MGSISRPRKGRLIAALAVAMVLASVSAVSANSAVAAKHPSLPPGGVYTCDWIAAHPSEAALARVSCDPAVFMAALSEAQSRDASVTSAPMGVQSTGCQWLPSQFGSVGQGVFAWSTYQYSTHWSWRGLFSPANYTWYLQVGGSTYTYGTVTDTNTYGPLGVPANIYRWGAQNHSGTAQRWDVCWNDF